MAHMLHRAYALPAISNVWARHFVHCPLLSITQLGKQGPPVSAVSSLPTLRDWYASQRQRQSQSVVRAQRWYCASTARADAVGHKNKVVFLGTPDVAADVLYKLIQASKQKDSTFQVAATVTQPGRQNKPSKTTGEIRPPKLSPVAQIATDHIPSVQLLMPRSAKDEDFLEALRALQPDLCITAAYGQFLPKAFLQIPRCGTVNIHPSLLPKYRGAAPVPRALQNGDKQVGVCLLYTVLKMDAGPIIAQEVVDIDEGIQAHELLHHLFSIGTRLLLENMNAIFSGEAAEQASKQIGTPTQAAKLDKSESELNWDEDAWTIHNKVRAFAPWPGTSCTYEKESENGTIEEVEVKILKTNLCSASDWPADAKNNVAYEKKVMYIKCRNGEVLTVEKLQHHGKSPVDPVAFFNGLQGRTVRIKQ